MLPPRWPDYCFFELAARQDAVYISSWRRLPKCSELAQECGVAGQWRFPGVYRVQNVPVAFWFSQPGNVDELWLGKFLCYMLFCISLCSNDTQIPKLIQITSDLIVYLANAPQSRNPTTPGPDRHLQPLLRICLAIQSENYQFVPLLLSKVNESLPYAIDPTLLNPPENVGYAMSADIFDGFGNAGMAQMPMGDYNASLPMNPYEPKYEDMGGNSPDSLPHSHHSHHSNGSPPGSQMGNEMPQNFVSSPGAVMSPGMDYTPNMGGFSISDMVMSPLGGAAPPNGINIQRQQQQLNNQPQMQGMPNQGINAPPMNQNMSSLYSGVRQPSRQSSFNMQSQTPLSAMSMSDGMDFNTLPPR
jgi:hypothetical protein